MKALSIHPYYAMGIAVGKKSVECRSWSTDYRGKILICSTAKKLHGTIPGHALCTVDLVDVVPFEKKHLDAALMEKNDFHYNNFAWILKNNLLIEPIPVKGKLSLWNFEEEEKIKYVPKELWLVPDGVNADDSEPGDWFTEHWEPLFT